MKRKIAQIVVGLPIEGPFDYLLNADQRLYADVGMRVQVPFGKRKLTGYITGFKKRSSFKKLKPVSKILDTFPPADKGALKLAEKISQYYCCSLGEAIEAMLPKSLRSGKEIKIVPPKPGKKTKRAKAEKILVHDTTNQARWPYLIDKIKKTLAAGKSVIFIVPEVSLIELVRSKLQGKAAKEIICIDKHLSDLKQLNQFKQIKEASASVVIASRSGVFAPVNNLGLIVVYEEENSAYKQDQSPFYHARTVSLMRAKIENASVVLVSSAPSAESWYMSSKKKLKRVSFAADKTPNVQIIDMSNYKVSRAGLSFALKSNIQKALNENKKTVVFLNRRGFSTNIKCTKCGHHMTCPRCNIGLTYTYAQKKLVCRLCNYKTDQPKICPECKTTYLRYTGAGIEKLESEIAREFPQARVSKFDKETKTLSSSANVIIATQAILKMKDTFSADIVGVVSADAELNRMDFTSGQKTLSLFSNLSDIAKEKLIIQTRLPGNYCIKAIRKFDFKKFYKSELKLRKEVGFPPFAHIIAITARAKKENAAKDSIQALYENLSKNAPKDIGITEPQADITPKLRGKYRYSIMLKVGEVASAVKLVRNALKSAKKRSGVIVSVNVDA